MDENITQRQISRRQLLKKGGLVLGAAAWMTPAMQVLNMTPAAAEVDGPDCVNSPIGSLPSGPSEPSDPGTSGPFEPEEVKPGRTLPREPND